VFRDALENTHLGETVVFTDDDITPEASWFEAIVGACRRWPNHQAFGGRIEPEWPRGTPLPGWVAEERLQTLAFARHYLGDVDAEYPPDVDPFGGNFWVRRAALSGVRFQEKIGAHATRQRLGDETEFRHRGEAPIYAPGALVKHRISAARMTKQALYRRALQGGLGAVYVHGLPEQPLFRRSPTLWRLERLRRIGRDLGAFRRGARRRRELAGVANHLSPLVRGATRAGASALDGQRPGTPGMDQSLSGREGCRMK
jgi:hypothetical protein